MKRRAFITLIGGGALWPLAARAQQADRMRRVGVIQTLAGDDPEERVRIAAFLRGLQELGWRDGRNVQIEYRWGVASDADRIRRSVAELIAFAPDVILAPGRLRSATIASSRRRSAGVTFTTMPALIPRA